MSEVTNELMFEVLKEIRAGQLEIRRDIKDVRDEMHAMRTGMLGYQQDISNIYSQIAGIKSDLYRVMDRLNLTEELH